MNDMVYYEFGCFVEFLAKNNFNMLELLVILLECICYCYLIMDYLIFELFFFKKCKDIFGGYVYV